MRNDFTFGMQAMHRLHRRHGGIAIRAGVIS